MNFFWTCAILCTNPDRSNGRIEQKLFAYGCVAETMEDAESQALSYGNRVKPDWECSVIVGDGLSLDDFMAVLL